VKFVYAPEGADPKKWDFAPEKLMSPEAEAIERNTGMTYAEWGTAVTKGSVLALHGLLFVLLKRDIPTIKWDDVQFSMSELDFELDDEETAEALAGLEAKAAKGDLDASDEALLERLRESGAEAAPKA